MSSNTQLSAGLKQLRLTVSTEAQASLIAYLRLMQKWNKAYNLTAITDFDKMIAYHLLDSLAIAPFVIGKNIVDVGSGAGLPGIPLAIIYPDKQFTLIDSIGKKTRFMSQAVRELGLMNVTVVQTRAEKYSSQAGFDTMVARAVASIEDLMTLAKHLLPSGGQLLLMKSDVATENVEKYGLRCEKLYVPGVDGERCVLIGF